MENRVQLLVVDDDEGIRWVLHTLLSAAEYVVRMAADGNEALCMAQKAPPDMVILDLAMPGLSGLEVCRALRTWYTNPILVLSAMEDATTKISALDLGADDYLTKPFSTGELLARVRALLRRAQPKDTQPPELTVGNLTLDFSRRRVLVEGREVTLTPTEYDILSLLARHAGRVLSSYTILEQVWGPAYRDDVQILRVHISNLRRKIEHNPSSPRYLLTEHGIGFRLADM